MNQIFTKLGLGRICLISFILLCSVFTSENAYSGRKWEKSDIKVSYDKTNSYIMIDFLFYEQSPQIKESCFLKSCEFYYQEVDSRAYPHFLMNIRTTKAEKVTGNASILMHCKNTGEKIKLFSHEHPNGMVWDDGEKLSIDQKLIPMGTVNTARMRVKWNSAFNKRINNLCVRGIWATVSKTAEEYFYQVYPVNTVNSKSNKMQNALSVLNSETSNQVKVIGETDAINVTGAEYGENIKIYTVSGVEVKSVVANDDVVNIKLPINQIYIVKAGQERNKVAL